MPLLLIPSGLSQSLLAAALATAGQLGARVPLPVPELEVEPAAHLLVSPVQPAALSRVLVDRVWRVTVLRTGRRGQHARVAVRVESALGPGNALLSLALPLVQILQSLEHVLLQHHV